jgi:hypothetical protein
VKLPSDITQRTGWQKKSQNLIAIAKADVHGVCQYGLCRNRTIVSNFFVRSRTLTLPDQDAHHHDPGLGRIDLRPEAGTELARKKVIHLAVRQRSD